jgi:uncharacterized BrkB/YihY/UPF0761 family membrane protein
MAERHTEEEERQQRRLNAVAAWARTTTVTGRTATSARLTRWRAKSSIVDAAVLVFDRDRSVAGTVLSSAVAFRLFLFFIPVVLAVVGLGGLVRSLVDADQVVESAGLTGLLAEQVRAALEQPGSAFWLTAAAGIVGVATTGRTLTKVLLAASALAWRAPLRVKARARVIVTVVGILVALTLLAALVNRVRETNLALAGVSLLAAAGVYAVGWLLLGHALPRTTTDPGAGIPGAVLVGLALAALQAVTQLYLPTQISGASQLYGALGAAVATLGWFFILGRVIVLALVTDAIVYERFGSLSQVVFALPLLRVLPRRFPSVARFFDLPQPEGSAAIPAE